MLSFHVHRSLLLIVSTSLLVKSSHCHKSGFKRRAFHGAVRPTGVDFHDESDVPQRSGGVSRLLQSSSATASSSSRIQKQQDILSTSICLVPRGGAVEESEGSGMEGWLRNIVRSLLATTDGSGAIHSTLTTIFKTLESVTGLRLLPEVKPKTKKSKKKKKVAKEKDEKETTDEGATPKAATKKKRKASKSKSSAATKMQLKRELKATNPMYRIQQELKAFIKDPPEHLSVATGKNIRIWIVTVEGIGIYKGETFRLRIQFPTNYPTVPPSVYFLPPTIPLHEHVYTNGDICLSLLGKDWRPTMTAQSVAHSILSILASASSKSLPMDNARHAQNQPGQYQADWVYHDDNC